MPQRIITHAPEYTWAHGDITNPDLPEIDLTNLIIIVLDEWTPTPGYSYKYDGSTIMAKPKRLRWWVARKALKL